MDIRILNCDRNEENILVNKTQSGEYKLIPIDHGFSLPDKIAINDFDIIWFDWNAVKLPFTRKDLEFIKKINPLEDCKRIS